MASSSKRTRLTEEALEKVHKLIDSHGGIVKKEEFADIDVDYRRILDFVELGELVRIKNGYYTDRMDRFSEEELIARLFPDACLCMGMVISVRNHMDGIWLSIKIRQNPALRWIIRR